jgi:hypothetical protein
MARIAAILSLACLMSCTKEPEPSVKPPDKTPSTFFRKFDRFKAKDKAMKIFTNSNQSGDGADEQFLQYPNRFYRLFYIIGTAPDDAIRGIVTELKDELLAQAQSAGAKIVRQPKESTAERSDVFAFPHNRNEFQNGHLGYHFTYTEGTIEGGVDVLASHSSGGRKEWLLVCAIHEKR